MAFPHSWRGGGKELLSSEHGESMKPEEACFPLVHAVTMVRPWQFFIEKGAIR